MTTPISTIADAARAPAALEQPHTIPLEELVSLLGGNVERGLTEDEAVQIRRRYGLNILTSTPTPPLWKRFLAQFNDVVVWILIVAAVVSGAIGEWSDSAAILAIVLLNAILGFVQEERAEHSLAALQRLAAPSAKVLRSGRLISIPTTELVPGDLIEIEAGDNVPADCRLIRAYSLRIQESALTGESVPVEKDSRATVDPDASLGDRVNMAYSSTVVARGQANAMIVATGMRTEIGRIAGMLARQEPEPTPLQKQLAGLGKSLVAICMILVVVVFALELRQGDGIFNAFLTSVSLAVAAVPEGLPAVVTMALAVGLQRMARRNALVRKLPSVETLGSVTVVCSDKTGTLTRNQMTVREAVVADGRFQISGAGYRPMGRFYRLIDEISTPIADPLSLESLRMLLTAAARCNHAQVGPSADGGEEWSVVGDPTEGAVLVAAMKAGIDQSDSSIRIVHEMPFDSDRKAMSVVTTSAPGLVRMFTKGAPETLLPICRSVLLASGVEPFTEDRRRSFGNENERMAQRAMRVLAFAFRDYPNGYAGPFEEKDLTLCGYMGMIDPPREEAKAAVQTCLDAGIRPVMITGDHPLTAAAIADELGIRRIGGEVLSGAQLDSLSDEELDRRIEGINVYARVSAQHKLRVVDAWKRRGEVVAMTGDGVNDAPAVKAADIGVAMGVIGTDVTREASAMVLLDDNFSSIVSAVEEGRAIYDNIQKFLTYLLSCNAGEMMLMLTASVLGWPVPLAPVQLLWINLVTDGLAALALGMEPPEPDVMRRKPRPPREGMLSIGQGVVILLQGMLIAGVGLAAFSVANHLRPDDLAAARTMTFCVLVYTELFRAFAARSKTRTMIELGFFSNPYLFGAVVISTFLQLAVVLVPFTRPVFETTGHSIVEWTCLAMLALTPVTVIEISKLARRSAASSRDVDRDSDGGSQ